MMRKYSVPLPLFFKNETVEDFMSFVFQYKNSIANVYFGLPDKVNNYHNYKYYRANQAEAKSDDDILKDCYAFLRQSRGVVKRILAMNSGVYNYGYFKLIELLDKKIIPFIDEYNIEGVICTDFNMAAYLHQKRPDLELHTSCNSYIETPREMQMWHDWTGISVFNPPREFLRRPDKLKEMRQTGYTLKYLVNESCLFGCPQSKNHLMAQAVNNTGFCAQCYHNDGSNFFRSTFIVPRWQSILDEYVDVYKISGRLCSLDFLLRTFDAYYNEKDDVDMGSIVVGSGSRTDNHILAKDFPDKLLTCECKGCHDCQLCNKLYKEKKQKNKYYRKDYSEEDYNRLLASYEIACKIKNTSLYFGKDEKGKFFIFE